MAKVSKHDTEEEREGDNRDDSRVSFFVAWHSVSVHNYLENIRELSRFQIGGWNDCMIVKCNQLCSSVDSKFIGDKILFVQRSPKISDIALALSLHLA